MATVRVLCSNLRGLLLNCVTPNGIVKVKLNPAQLSALDGVTPIPQETVITQQEFDLIKSQFQSNPVWNQISVVSGSVGKSQVEDLNATANDFAPVNTNLNASGEEVVKQAKEKKPAKNKQVVKTKPNVSEKENQTNVSEETETNISEEENQTNVSGETETNISEEENQTNVSEEETEQA